MHNIIFEHLNEDITSIHKEKMNHDTNIFWLFKEMLKIHDRAPVRVRPPPPSPISLPPFGGQNL